MTTVPQPSSPPEPQAAAGAPPSPPEPQVPASPVASSVGAAAGTSAVAAAPAVAGPPVGPAAGLAALGFGLLMLFLGVLAWDGDTALPDLTQVASGLVTALLGLVINPGRTVRRPVWNGLAGLALLAAVSAGAAVLVFPRHVDAVPALTSAVAAFAGLYVDTAAITHSGR
ncbi:hypothetical protein GCM10009665_69560 [Kitasatospora nipponensis]|uniref:SPW repeat-containing protein n=1 Tax=Kitasatospora nipponensis TaxID=258049 RepID=A0ABP4HQK4_9ACTN